MTRVLCITSGRHIPSSRFRIQQWVAPARSRGVQLTLFPAWPALYQASPWLGWRLSDAIRRMRRRIDRWRARWGHFDVILIERQIQGDDDPRFEKLFRPLAPRMVLDVDDAVHETYPAKFRELIPLMDLVVCGNRFLVSSLEPFAPRATAVVPTCVDTLRYHPLPDTPSSGVCRLGWIATSSNLPFLFELKPALVEAARGRQCELHVMTDPVPAWEELRRWPLKVVCEPWSAAREVEFLQRCDIGLMPLPDTSWTRQKCGFKLLQSMACGRPVIASPVGVNREIVRDGVDGLLAATLEEWTQALQRLIDDVDLRNRQGRAARERAQAEYSLDVWADRWVAAVTGSSNRDIAVERGNQTGVNST